MKKLIISSLVLAFTVTVFAQKPKVMEGKWESISGIKKFDLEFDYSDVSVPDFDKEADYIKQKMKEKDEDEAGQGEVWKAKYYADREAHFEPKFIESFNKRGTEQVGKNFDEAEYLMKVQTTEQYNGWNVGVMRKAARIGATITIFKRGTATPLFIVKYENIKGADAMGFDFESHSRVAEAYAKLAKSFLRDLDKKS